MFNSKLVLILVVLHGAFTYGLARAGGVAQLSRVCSNDSSQAFISYLEQLSDLRVIGAPELNDFVHELEQGKLINPVPHTSTAEGNYFREPTHEIHYGVLQDYLADASLDHACLITWTHRKLAVLGMNEISRHETRSNTQSVFRKIEFAPLLPKSAEVRPFEMMTTLVTQMQWSSVMGSNPSEFVNGPESISLAIQGKMVSMLPDHPVENVSWTDIQLFLYKYNQQARVLHPLEKYRYRLPSVLEWNWTLRTAAWTTQPDGLLSAPFAASGFQYDQFIWYLGNSNQSTHAVGTKSAARVQGKPFYDLLGNVTEWMDVSPSYPYRDGVTRVVRGCDWKTSTFVCNLYSQNSYAVDEARPTIGFRMVRVKD